MVLLDGLFLQGLIQGEMYDDPHAEFFYKGPDTAEVCPPPSQHVSPSDFS